MELTGKAKEKFERWYNTKYLRSGLKGFLLSSIRLFYRKTISEQWGVYQDFADSLGYELIIKKINTETKFMLTIDEIYFFNFRDYPEPRIKAINMFNRILNNKSWED